MRELLPGRMRCCIIGCGRTGKVEPNIVTLICGKHWRLADVRLRRLVTRIERKAKRVGWTPQLLRAHHRLFEKCHAQAQERSLGI